MSNNILFNGNDAEGLKKLMAEHGNSHSPKYGKNAAGEDVEIHIAKDSIVYKTYQSNGWLRVNHYDENGQPAGETFEGRWR